MVRRGYYPYEKNVCHNCTSLISSSNQNQFKSCDKHKFICTLGTEPTELQIMPYNDHCLSQLPWHLIMEGWVTYQHYLLTSSVPLPIPLCSSHMLITHACYTHSAHMFVTNVQVIVWANFGTHSLVVYISNNTNIHYCYISKLLICYN